MRYLETEWWLPGAEDGGTGELLFVSAEIHFYKMKGVVEKDNVMVTPLLCVHVGSDRAPNAQKWLKCKY